MQIKKYIEIRSTGEDMADSTVNMHIHTHAHIRKRTTNTFKNSFYRPVVLTFPPTTLPTQSNSGKIAWLLEQKLCPHLTLVKKKKVRTR